MGFLEQQSYCGHEITNGTPSGTLRGRTRGKISEHPNIITRVVMHVERTKRKVVV